MITTRVSESSTLREACHSFLADLGGWIGACIAELSDEPPTDGHDQGTFTVSWEPHIRATGDKRALSFMKDLRDKTREHFLENGKWKHGYWRMQEVHHGTEHFELFLGTLWRLDPADADTVQQFTDAAEHMGNWASEVPAWFDWEKGLFRSFHFGTDRVGTEPGTETNVPDHFRCLNICLLAHAMTGEPRYLELSRLYGDRWAGAVLARDELPVGLRDGRAVYSFAEETDMAYRSFAGQAPELRAQVDRAENFLASGAIEALLQLWGKTAEERFRLAAEDLLDVLVTQLDDPDAGAAANAIRAHRRTTHDRRYDGRVLDAAERLDPFSFSELAIEPEVRRERRPSGIGKRADAPDWFEDGAPRKCNSILLSLAAEIAGDERLAARAVDIARACFSLARKVYPHGRHHGCSARTVSAVARGHGRENGAGVVTAVLAPAIGTLGAGRRQLP